MKIYPETGHETKGPSRSYVSYLKMYTETENTVESGVLSQWCFERLKAIELVLFTIEVLVYSLSLIYFEMKYTLNSNDQDKYYILCANVALFIIRLILIVIKNAVEFNYSKMTSEIPISLGFWSTKLPKILLIEFLFSLFFQNPFYENITYNISMISGYPDIVYTYSVNDLMAMASIIRAVFSFRYIKHLSVYNNNSSRRICTIMQNKCDLFFEAKCYIAEHPLKTILIVFVVAIMNFAYLIRIAEFENPFRDFTNYYNCLWYTSITMSTVGYGDYVAIGASGRILSFIVALLGILIIELITVVAAKRLEMKNIESKTFELYLKISVKEKVDKEFFKMLYYLFKLSKTKKRKETIYLGLYVQYYTIRLFNTYRKFIKYKQNWRKSQLQTSYDFQYTMRKFTSISKNNADDTAKLIDVISLLQENLI